MAHYGTEIAQSNKFPGKLWRIVNTCTSGAIGWGQGGHTVVVHQSKFQKEFLDVPHSVFKTTNIGSFIRQLNLYGFRKLNALRYADNATEFRGIHEFQNDYFVQGCPELLSQLRRNVGIRRSRELAVKRRLEAIQGLDVKRPRMIENGQYVMTDTGAVTYVPNQDPGKQNSFQTTQQSQYPVYVQWDGQTYKYIVLPDGDSNTNAQGQAQQQQQQQQQQQLQLIIQSQQDDGEGGNLQVVHMPENESDPASPQEYYLVSLVPTDTNGDKESPLKMSLLDQTAASSLQECYKLAEELDTDPTLQEAGTLNQSDDNCGLASPSAILSSLRIPNTSQISYPSEFLVENPEAISDALSVLSSDSPVSMDDGNVPSAAVKVEHNETTLYGYPIILHDVDKSELDVYIRDNDTNSISGDQEDKENINPSMLSIAPESDCDSKSQPIKIEPCATSCDHSILGKNVLRIGCS